MELENRNLQESKGHWAFIHTIQNNFPERINPPPLQKNKPTVKNFYTLSNDYLATISKARTKHMQNKRFGHLNALKLLYIKGTHQQNEYTIKRMGGNT